jgi:sterol desaturase/sphingolipid hydroxylase (fatty acid hydroxylase superfamily)
MGDSDTDLSGQRRRGIPPWVAGVAACGAFLGLLWLERRRPLRASVEPKGRRTARNLALAGLSAAAVQLAERPVNERVGAWVERRRFGLVQRLPLPRWGRTLLAVLLLDYTLYLWHVLAHKVPWLWRLHQPHHVDLDMDASTALRFHFTELLASVPWRAGQIVAIGADPLALSLWQTLVLVSILFHHSNVEIPARGERLLSLLVVTPRMHGLHHSMVEAEASSNWSSLLSIWDRLHGTLLVSGRDEPVVVGVPAYGNPRDVTLPRVIEMPFVRQRESYPRGGEPHGDGRAR